MHQFPVTRSENEWRERLTPEQYRVMRSHGTEPPGSCALLAEKRPGRFLCVGCDQPGFEGKVKFESGTGWPSFNEPVPGSVETSRDSSYGMARTEGHCATRGSHLGHVFEDRPPPPGLRYCFNGVALLFDPASSRRRAAFAPAPPRNQRGAALPGAAWPMSKASSHAASQSTPSRR